MESVGCLDPRAIEWSPLATIHDQSLCMYGERGCMDSEAVNYMESATIEDSCVYPRLGCMVKAGTLNFDSAATVKGKCVYALLGCTDSFASNCMLHRPFDDPPPPRPLLTALE